MNEKKIKIMASSSIASWPTDGETMETVRDFILGHSKITSGDDCCMELRHLFLGRKAMTNLDSILKTETVLCQWRSRSLRSGYKHGQDMVRALL